jgi:glycoprotein endo-alpha-1,2-mannosidase
MKYCLIIAVMILLFPLKKLHSTQFKGYPLTIDVITTSDWTECNFANTDFYYIDDTLTKSEKNSSVNIGILSVEKESYDSTLTRVRFNIFLSSKLPKQIEFIIKKGAIGETGIVIFSQAETIATISTWKSESSYTIKRNVFKKIPIQTYRISPDDKEVESLVLAFYYPWYEENWLHNDSQLVAHQPVNGFYNSSDESMIQNHILTAKNTGIDGFIVSWWGRNSFTDKNFKKMLSLSESLGFKNSLYLETANSLEDLRDNLNYIETTYTNYSSFLKIKGSPVMFIFSRILDKLPLDSLVTLAHKFTIINHGFSYSNLKGFSGFHEYLLLEKNLETIKWKYAHAAQIANRENKIMAATVMPGYDDRRIRNPGSYIDRKSGAYYKGIWKAALYCNPDLILITSFNEWFEGTEIEPSIEYKNYYIIFC